MSWSASDIPSLKGRSAVVTGTGGLGFQDALELARAGADVVIAGRNAKSGADAVMQIRKQVPSAQVEFEHLDLANLEAVSDFGARLRKTRPSLDVLINNAAVMAPPTRKETADGFELQFGTNYLGHFALTAHLLPLLREGTNPRVITVSSIAVAGGAINFSDINARRDYKPMVSYGQSKLACLMFAFELQRRSKTGHWGISSIAAHPGVSRTNLIPNGAGRMSFSGFLRTFLWFLFQEASQGALPTLFAATSADAEGGLYYGPTGIAELRGPTGVAKIPPQATERDIASRLWELSEAMVNLRYPDVGQLRGAPSLAPAVATEIGT